jgi:hypothetical protein
MNKFLTIYLSVVESIEAIANNVINLILQPLYAVARIIISICDVWGIDYEAEEQKEQPENKKTIGFQRQ